MRLDFSRARTLLQNHGFTKTEIEHWIALYHRATFAHLVFTDRNGKPWQLRPYQEDSFESYALRKVHCDGRDVGKTTEIELIAAWASVAVPDSEMLIATQCENHLYPLMDRIHRRIQTTPALAGNLVELHRSPSWHMRFRNGFVLWGRIAGPRGINFQGLHVDWQIIDEAQEMTETAWGELYQALNAGGKRWVYGVPNGLRNTFYRMTQITDAEQYNWPSTLHPDFTSQKEEELALLYGGKDSPGYVHRVLGQHGAPAHAVFDLEDYLACVQDSLDFCEICLDANDHALDVPNPPQGVYYLGCDLGYARDPSEFVIYRLDGTDLINTAHIHLAAVPYPRQQEVILELDRAYNFHAIGIDNGNSGRAVAHALMGLGSDWCEKVFPIDFGGNITVETLPDGRPDRRPAKQFMTELLTRRMAERTITFPRYPQRETQYAAHTYSVTPNGRILYDKGDDHIIDADRCALLAHYLDTHRDHYPVTLRLRLESF